MPSDGAVVPVKTKFAEQATAHGYGSGCLVPSKSATTSKSNATGTSSASSETWCDDDEAGREDNEAIGTGDTGRSAIGVAAAGDRGREGCRDAGEASRGEEGCEDKPGSLPPVARCKSNPRRTPSVMQSAIVSFSFSTSAMSMEPVGTPSCTHPFVRCSPTSADVLSPPNFRMSKSKRPPGPGLVPHKMGSAGHVARAACQPFAVMNICVGCVLWHGTTNCLRKEPPSRDQTLSLPSAPPTNISLLLPCPASVSAVLGMPSPSVQDAGLARSKIVCVLRSNTMM
mmetsp:Transcript_147451/g.367611  ORF Transcript_147451/g.367611 Transcript_147451/m.367611 type:complete len:284 (+) Transcript_147451:299-1150(+)